MGAYDYNLPDSSTRQKLMQMSQQFAPDIDPYYDRLKREGGASLRGAFGLANQEVAQQFSPMFRAAQSRLGGAGLLADSGYANRLNRQLQQGAFGELSNRYGQAAQSQSENQLSALERLIQMRLGGQQDILSSLLGSAQKKRNLGDALGGVVGAALGTATAAYGGGGGRPKNSYYQANDAYYG